MKAEIINRFNSLFIILSGDQRDNWTEINNRRLDGRREEKKKKKERKRKKKKEKDDDEK